MATYTWIDTSQRLQVLLNDCELTLADFQARDDVVLSLRTVDRHVSVETLTHTQLIRLTASLLRRVLAQQQLNDVGWESADYCLMVTKAAYILIAAGTGFQHDDACLIAFAAQVHSSELVPDLSTALSTLAQTADAAAACDPALSADAADSLLTVAYLILDRWPGNLGALVSATAGPLVQPALQLAAAKVRNAYKAAPTDTRMPLDLCSMLVQKLGYQMLLQVDRQLKQQAEQHHQQQQRHPYSSQLQMSPDFLQLQLSVLALKLQPCFMRKVISHSAALAPGSAGDSVPAHGRTADATATAASSSSAGPAQQVWDIHRSNHAVAGSHAAPLTDLQAAQCQQQQILLLQALYPCSTQGTTSWETVLAAASQAELSICYHGPLGSLLNNMAAVTIGVRHLMHDSLSALAGLRSPGANDSSTEQSLAAVQGHLNNLKALQVLPVLLLRSLQYAAPPEASAAVFRRLCAAVSRLLDRVTACWSCQAVLYRSEHAAGIDIQQLPLAELLDLLLQHVKLLLKHMTAAAADGGPPAVPMHMTAEDTTECTLSADVTAVRDVGSSSGSDSSMQDKRTEAATAPETAAAAAAGNSVAAADSATLAAAAADDDDVDASIRYLLLAVAGVARVCGTSVQSSSMLQPRVQQLTVFLEQYIRNSSSMSSRRNSSVDIDFVQLCVGLLQLAPLSDPQHPLHHRGLLVLAAAAADPDSDQQQRLFALLISLLKGAIDLSTLSAGSCWHIGLEIQLLQAVANAASHLWNTLVSSRNSVVGSSYSLSNAADNAAAAPWLVALARVLIKTAGMFSRVLECEVSLLEVPGNVTAGSSHQCSKDYEAWHILQVFTLNVASALAIGTGHCSQAADGSGSSSSSSVSNLSNPAAASAGSAAATGHTIINAVPRLQMTELAASAEQLRAVCQRLHDLYDACFESCGEAADTTQGSEMRPADLEPAAAAAMSPCDTTQLRHTLQQWDIQSLQQRLCEAGQRVCAALPLGFCCNNPSCNNMRDDSELIPVSGRSCVCAGCEVARYCCVVCQAAHWQQHKPICKLIKRQNRAEQQQQQAV